MKATDMLLHRERLTARQRTITLILIWALLIALSGLAYDTFWNHPGQPPIQYDKQHSIFDYPVLKPGFTVSAHDPLPPDQAVNHDALLLATYLGPAGWYLNCQQRFFYIVPYQACALLLQPRTTKSLADWFDAEQGHNATLATTLIASTTAAVCGAITKNAYFAGVCFALGMWAAGKLVDETRLARSRGQCLRLNYNYTPSVSAILSISAHQPPVPTNVYAYGAWETWVWHHVNGPHGSYEVPVWEYPTACKMPRDCVNPPGQYWCVV